MGPLVRGPGMKLAWDLVVRGADLAQVLPDAGLWLDGGERSVQVVAQEFELLDPLELDNALMHIVEPAVEIAERKSSQTSVVLGLNDQIWVVLQDLPDLHHELSLACRVSKGRDCDCVYQIVSILPDFSSSKRTGLISLTIK